MMHLAGKGKETGCCQVPYDDLPMSDQLTFEDRKVTCGTVPLRHPELLAEWLYEQTRGSSDRGWGDLDRDRRVFLCGVAREALSILGFDVHE